MGDVAFFAGVRAPVRCVHCSLPIVGCTTTRYGRGWVHAHNGRERCTPTDARKLMSGGLAAPVTCPSTMPGRAR